MLRRPDSPLGLIDAAAVDFVHLASFVVVPEFVEDGSDNDSADVDLDQLQDEDPVATQVDRREFSALGRIGGDETGWDGIRRDGTGLDGVRRDGTRRDGTGLDGIGRDGGDRFTANKSRVIANLFNN